LIRQYNAMFQMKKEFENYATVLDRAFSMQAMKFPDYKDARIDFESLSFLTELSEIDKLLALTIEQERFEQTVISMEMRNNFHIEKLQPAIEKHNINGRKLPLEEIERMLGQLIFHTAINSVTLTYKLLCENLESNYELHQKIWNIAKRIFPDQIFLHPSKLHPQNQPKL